MQPTDIVSFESREFGEIRTVVKDEEIGFLASDLCRVLGTKTSNLKSILDSDNFLNVYNINIGNHGGKKPLILERKWFLHSRSKISQTASQTFSKMGYR